MSFIHFIKELNGKRVEGELIKTVFYTILSSAFTYSILAFLYVLSYPHFDSVFAKYKIPFFFVTLSYALLTPAIYQIRAYHELPCMSGMMIGMTTGMLAGFLPGFYVASTNGMFVGGFFGVALGMLIGLLNGKCCGIMGIMEGLMAGFMGGLMGAMTAFMLLNDHLLLASVLVFLISAIISIGLTYLIYKETKETERKRPEGHFFTVLLTVLLTIITAILIVLGPRSVIFS